MVKASPSLTFSQAISAWGGRLFSFKGRSRRSEFWWVQLLVVALNIFVPFVSLIVDLLTIPLMVRRLHDVGRSGWWYGVFLILRFLFVVAIVYGVVSIIMATAPGGAGLRHSLSAQDDVAEAIAPYVVKFILAALFFAVYGVVLVVMCCADSEARANRWGPSPKYVETGEPEPASASTRYAGLDIEPLDIEK